MTPQNSAGEPMADRQPNQPEARHCSKCGGPCRVPDWARDSSWYANNPGKYDLAISHNHGWLEPSRLAEVARVQAETRALVLAPTFACVRCGRHAFPEADVVCFWCRRSTETRAVAA